MPWEIKRLASARNPVTSARFSPNITKVNNMTETLTEQLKKLLSKVNSIQGQQLTFAQRLKAVEEKKPAEFEGDKDLLFRIAKYLGSAVGFTKDEDTVQEVEIG